MGILAIVRGLAALLFYQTSWSYLGRQGLGLKFVLLWVARTKEQRPRIMEHCRGTLNTNPFVAGAVIGSIIWAEDEVQELHSIDRLASVAQSTLAAGGDRFFWQTLRPALTALGVLLGLLHSPFAALGFLLAFVAVTQGTRAIGLQLGYRKGRDAIGALQGQFDKWTRSLSRFAAIVTGMIITQGLLGEHPIMVNPKSQIPMTNGGLGWPLGIGHGNSSYLLIPLAILAYLGLRLKVSQTYLLVIFLLIFAVAKVVL